MKYGVGRSATFALVFLMRFPLVSMALLKTVGGVTNQPLDVSVKIAIKGYEVAGEEGGGAGTCFPDRTPCSPSCGPRCGFRA